MSVTKPSWESAPVSTRMKRREHVGKCHGKLYSEGNRGWFYVMLTPNDHTPGHQLVFLNSKVLSQPTVITIIYRPEYSKWQGVSKDMYISLFSL